VFPGMWGMFEDWVCLDTSAFFEKCSDMNLMKVDKKQCFD